jgi:DNA-binding transcriptional ArsR family regulator
VTQLIDDQLLSRVLRGGAPPKRREAVYTTGYWYVRLCQAVLGTAERSGVLSSSFSALPAPTRERALSRLLELPDTIGLLSLRELGPTIGHLRQRHDLNVLGIEALAAALHLGADVYLSAPSPRLETALRAEGHRVTIRQ